MHANAVEINQIETPLRQSDAVLLVLQTLRETESAGVTHRLVLEGIASLAARPEFKCEGCRVLSVFDKRSWQRRLYESLAHLEQTGCVRTSVQGYALTAFAQKRLEGLRTTDAEAERILGIDSTVRQYLNHI